MCDYEDMRDTETQFTAGQSEKEREGERKRKIGSHIYLYSEIFIK